MLNLRIYIPMTERFEIEEIKSTLTSLV